MSKKTLLAINFLLCISFIFASPGLSEELGFNDNSGEYVYYRDYTFTRESYLGILYYDDSTYQIRYYAPNDYENYLPEKELAILIAVNPTKNYWEMIGERIISGVLPTEEDIDLVNYMHDILYEFYARRHNVVLSQSDNVLVDVSSAQEYVQFGGNVDIVFSNLIPIFNIKEILDSKQSKVLDCVTIGQLTSSNDKGFNDFKGFTNKQEENPKTKKAKAKKIPAKKVLYQNQEAILDTNWNNTMENIWTLGNDALLALTEINALSSEKGKNDISIVRKLLESFSGTYTNLPNSHLKYDVKKGQYIIKTQTFMQDNQNYMVSTKIVSELPDNNLNFHYFSLSVYQDAYDKNPLYFEKIVNSYKVKN